VALDIYESAKGLVECPFRGRPGRKPDSRELVILGLPFIAVYRAPAVRKFAFRKELEDRAMDMVRSAIFPCSTSSTSSERKAVAVLRPGVMPFSSRGRDVASVDW
jgi:hypothetical protein